jgi:hypothetical protein
MSQSAHRIPTQEEIDDESRKIRRLAIAANLTLQVIAEGAVTLQAAQEMAAAIKNLALTLFPGKEFAYEILYGNKLRRLIAGVYRLN